MFTTFISLTLVFGASSAFAKNPSQGTEINYSVYSKNYPAEQLNGPVNIEQKDQQVLSPEARLGVFEKAGIDKTVKKWSHFEQDMLVLRAKNKTLVDLSKSYPKIPKSQLSKLQQSLKEVGK